MSVGSRDVPEHVGGGGRRGSTVFDVQSSSRYWDLQRFAKSRYFRNVRAQRGRYGASSHDHDRIDGRDDAGFLDDDLNHVVSVLLASIIDILPHDTSVLYSPPRRSDASLSQ